jgi:aspartyl aminopeptidase
MRVYIKFTLTLLTLIHTSHTYINILIQDTAKQATQKGVHMAMLFDHEEVGSSSCTGAGSPLLMDTIKLVIANLADESK